MSESKYCPQCGAGCDYFSKFCAHCGNPLSDSAEGMSKISESDDPFDSPPAFQTVYPQPSNPFGFPPPDAPNDPNPFDNPQFAADTAGARYGSARHASGKKKAVWIVAGVIAFIIILVIVITQVGGAGGSAGQKEAKAVTCAEQLLSESFGDPSSAIWNESSVVEKDGYDRYIVYIDVTAENGYGIMVNEYYYVCVRLGEGDTFYYSTYLPYVEASDYALVSLKSMNDWGEPPED